MSDVTPCHGFNCTENSDVDADIACGMCQDCFVHDGCGREIEVEKNGRTVTMTVCRKCALAEEEADDPSKSVARASSVARAVVNTPQGMQSPAASLSGSRVEIIETAEKSIPTSVRCANVNCLVEDPTSLVEKSESTRCKVCMDAYCHQECLIELKCSACTNKSMSARMNESLKKKQRPAMDQEEEDDVPKVLVYEDEQKMEVEVKSTTSEEDSNESNSDTSTEGSDEDDSKKESRPKKKRKKNPSPEKKIRRSTRKSNRK